MRLEKTLFFALFLALAAPSSHAQQIRLMTENDIFSSQPARDDLHTFALRLDIEGGGMLYGFREDAFTDREGGIRFDETQLVVGRELRPVRSFRTHLEVGLVRVGRGLLGEDLQNRVHRTLGSDEVELPYTDTSAHGRLAIATERSFALGSSVSIGPRVELDWVSDLRSHVLVAVQAGYRPHRNLELHALVGGRWSDAEFAPLERHNEDFGAAARVGVTLFERIVAEWSYNDHGDGRTHLAVGYRFSSWRAGDLGPVRN